MNWPSRNWIRSAPYRRAAGFAIGWTALGFLFALPALGRGDPSKPLLSSLAQWWAWGLVSALISELDVGLPVKETQVLRRLLIHVPASLLLTAVYTYLATALRALLGVGTWNAVASLGPIAVALRGMFLWSWLVYWLILGALLARRYHHNFLLAELRTERLEHLATEARLHTLRLQLDPHFLFNALNTISAQVESDPRLARRMIEHLGDLLRLTLETKDRTSVTLAQELNVLDHYLAIQRIRFGERLQVETEISADVSEALVPVMLIQPLVENSVRHGLSKRASGGKIWICARRSDHQLQIEVADNGEGIPDDWDLEESAGVGLSVTRLRVVNLDPTGGSSLRLAAREGGGAIVSVSIPLQFAKSEIANA